MANQPEFEDGFGETVGQLPTRDVPLRDFSSFRIGGPADFFFEAGSPEDLAAAVGFARQVSVPFYVIGGGCNLLFADAGFRGLIVRNRAQAVIPEIGGEGIRVFSGTPLAKLLQYALDNGLKGFEFAAGIPGTVGGAICGNAGAFGRSIGELCREAVLLDAIGNEVTAAREDLAFGYRRSRLQQSREIVLSAVLDTERGEPARIRGEIEANLEKRRAHQPPWGTPSAGSFFKNSILPDGTKSAAGRLLEEVGAKELRIGDAGVYPGHANFLINLGKAKAADVLALAAELKERVRTKFGVNLEEEVIYLPAVPSKP
ncbi:MAG: UDP-N-acetylmuramate dehydrogenase [Candidatus Aminicenantales bacterium]